MKILHIVSNISIRSGVMSVIMNYYRNIDKEKIQFDFLYFDERPNDYRDEIESLRGRIFKISRPTSMIEFNKSKASFFKKHYKEYKAIHLHDAFLIFCFFDAKRKAGVEKIIVHAHAVKFGDKPYTQIRNRLFGIGNYFIPDLYFACSQKAGNIIFGKKFDSAGIVINNAIDLEKFHPDKRKRELMRKQLGVENSFVIGHVGNFTHAKNHMFLLKVFRNIIQDDKNAKLILVGTGELKEDIIKTCHRYNIADNVFFLGTRNDVNDIMRSFDCFIFPSFNEGLGIVLIEAQACGVGCVFSNVIPSEAQICKQHIIPLGINEDAEIWAKEVMKFKNSESYNDIELIRKAGFDIKIESKRLEEIYLEM